MHKKLFAVLGFVLLYNVVFYRVEASSAYHAGPGISIPMFILSLHGLLFLLRNKEGKYLTTALTYSTFAFVFSFFLSFSANEILRPIYLLLTLFSTAFAFYFYNLGSGFSYLFTEYVIVPFKSLGQLISGIFSTPKLFNPEKLSKVNNPASSALLKGLLFAFPLVLIFIILFNLADPIYNKYTLDVLSNIQKLLVGPIWERILVSAILLILGLGSLAGLLKLRHESEKEKSTEISHNKQIELITFLSLPILVFLTFILVQFEYLFTNISERSLAQIGIQSLTYSEYVRKGFFELMIASAISLSIIGYVSRYLNRVKNKYEHILKSLISVLVIETQLILFSVVWRVAMYQMEHGLTRFRIIGMFFLIWLSMALFLYLAKVLANLQQKIIFWSLTLITVFSVSLLTFANVDRLIAVNYRPTVNDKVDYFYITHLSYDSSKGWAKAIEDMESQVPEYEQRASLDSNDSYRIGCLNLSLNELKEKQNFLNNKYGKNGLKNWREFNFSEYQAFETINSQSNQFNKLDSLIQRTKSLREKFLKDNKYETYITPYCGSY